MRKAIEEPLKGPGYYERNVIFDLLSSAGLVREEDYLPYYQTCTARDSGFLSQTEAKDWARRNSVSV